MLGRLLAEISEADLEGLVQAAVPEGLTLEFKRELNLGQTNEKREAAKDVSALANAAGGRLLYGVAEKPLSDGSVVAGGVVPLTDGTAGSRLADVLHSAIHPRPRFDLRAVPVTGGHVLVVDVYSSSGMDLHMVTGYGENRFYRRGPTGVVLMTEPEIREAYVRIGELRASLDARVEALARPELECRSAVDESILVIPLYSRANLVDPRQVRQLGLRLRQGVLQELAVGKYFADLQLRYEGYRLIIGGTTEKAKLYIVVLKTGVVHFSSNSAFDDKGEEFHFSSLGAAHRILQALVISHEVLRLSAYSGPVRLLYQLRAAKPWRIDPEFSTLLDTIPAGTYGTEIPEITLDSTMGSWGTVVKDMLDPIFHAAGGYECPHFTFDGVLLKNWAKDFAVYARYMRIEQ
jgi:hypothetical protein